MNILNSEPKRLKGIDIRTLSKMCSKNTAYGSSMLQTRLIGNQSWVHFSRKWLRSQPPSRSTLESNPFVCLYSCRLSRENQKNHVSDTVGVESDCSESRIRSCRGVPLLTWSDLIETVWMRVFVFVDAEGISRGWFDRLHPEQPPKMVAVATLTKCVSVFATVTTVGQFLSGM